LQRPDAPVEDAAAALPVDVLGAVAGQARDDVDLLCGEELGGVLLARLLEDGQVAAVEDAAASLAGSADEVTEAVVELGGAAGQVEGRDAGVPVEELDDPGEALRVEAFGALRAGLDVAVVAGEAGRC
jgi:hypothetical protein